MFNTFRETAGTAAKPKDDLYVLLAVGMYEGQWRPFESEISGLKLELADGLSRQGEGRQLPACPGVSLVSKVGGLSTGESPISA